MTTPLPAWLDAFRRRLGAELIETHISWLLLAGEFAWKLKKPITLPFLDYGTPALRRRCCEEELRLNRRFAPDLYLGLEAVGDSGEWAVKMRRFPEAQRLDHVCARGGLSPDPAELPGRSTARRAASRRPSRASEHRATTTAPRASRPRG